MKLTKKQILKLTLIIVVITITIAIAYLYYKDTYQESTQEKEPEVLELTTTETETPKEEIPKKVYVDIKGAIINPGVYEVEEDKKIIDVITLAGGFTENADTTLINLAKKIKDEMVIIIYTKKEVSEAKIKETLSLKNEDTCICPQISNDACLNAATTTKEKSSSTTTSSNEKVNINTASLEELQTLNGIGEGKAKAIIAYREENGNFSNIEDIQNVNGIGESVYEKIKDSITV